MSNSVGNYPDFVIKDVSSSFNEYKQYSSLPNTPLLWTIDGPLSLKGTGVPYTVTVSKNKDQ